MVDFSESTGNYLLQPQSALIDSFSEGLFVASPLVKEARPNEDEVNEYGLYGHIDLLGNWIIPPIYMSAGIFSEGLACVSVKRAESFRDHTFFGFIDKNNKLILPYEYHTSIGAYFSDGLCPAYVRTGNSYSDTLWGYIDKTGKWIIEPQFSFAYNFKDGVAVVRTNELYGVISRR